MFDKIFVSTDSKEYADISIKYGAEVPFLRSELNSSDSAGSWDVVREVFQELEKNNEYYDEVMLLQATSPLRLPEDISKSIELLREKNAMSVVSLT